MYIDSLKITNFRCFENARVTFEYDGRHRPGSAPRLPNINLLLGDNGTGKSALLKAIALAVLGPIMHGTGFRPYLLVRRTGEQKQQSSSAQPKEASVQVETHLHTQDVSGPDSEWSVETRGTATGRASITRRGSIETVNSPSQMNSERWEPLFEDFSPAFFLVAYGANRRVESSETFDSGARERTRAPRYQRVAGLFEETVSLTPVNVWWDTFRRQGRLPQGLSLLNTLLPEGVQAADEILYLRSQQSSAEVTSDVLFNVLGTALPFPALSDGYRGFVGWVVDLLFQMSQVTPPGKKLTDLCGVVIVDELDLLLHPDWQQTVVESLAKTFPRLQFFFTTHSPIVTGTLEAANILRTQIDPETGSATITKSQERVHGLSADQILDSQYFGIASSRAPDTERRLRDLTERTWRNDKDAAVEYLRILANGDDTTAEDKGTKSRR